MVRLLIVAALVGLAAANPESHDRKIDAEITEVLEDERNEIASGNTVKAQEKFNEALGLMRKIKEADFGNLEKEEKKEEEETKEEKKEDKKEEKVADTANMEKKEKKEEEKKEDMDKFQALRKSMRESLQKVKGNAKARAQAEELLKKHHTLLTKLKNAKSSGVDKVNAAELLPEMKELTSALTPLTSMSDSDLEADSKEEEKTEEKEEKTEEKEEKTAEDADHEDKENTDLEKEDSSETFNTLKKQVRSSLDALKDNKELRSKAEVYLKKHHKLLENLKDIKAGSSHVKTSSLLAELKEMNAEVSPLAKQAADAERQPAKKAASKKVSAPKHKATHGKVTKTHNGKHKAAHALERSQRIQKEMERIDAADNMWS